MGLPLKFNRLQLGFDRVSLQQLDRIVMRVGSSRFGELLHAAAICRAAPRGPLGRMERLEHLNTFLEWLCLDIERQVGDLERFLDDQDQRPRDILITWMQAGSYVTLIPDFAAKPERELF